MYQYQMGWDQLHPWLIKHRLELRKFYLSKDRTKPMWFPYDKNLQNMNYQGLIWELLLHRFIWVFMDLSTGSDSLYNLQLSKLHYPSFTLNAWWLNYLWNPLNWCLSKWTISFSSLFLLVIPFNFTNNFFMKFSYFYLYYEVKGAWRVVEDFDLINCCITSSAYRCSWL